MLAISVSAMASLCCWIGTLGPEQRWGSASEGGRYSTNFNALSLARDPTLSQISREDLLDVGLCEDRILGLALIAADTVYHDLLVQTEPGRKEQYSFWASIFGPMHGRLYYFKIKDVIQFKPPTPQIPAAWNRKVKTFFAEMDRGGPRELVQLLQQEGIELPEWFNDACHLYVRLPSAFAHNVVAAEWDGFGLPDPKCEFVFHKNTRKHARLIGWKYISSITSDFAAVPALQDLDVAITAARVLEAADVVRFLAAKLNPGQGDEDRELWSKCQGAAQLLQRFHDELDPKNMQHGVLELRGRLSSSKIPYQAQFLIKCLMLCHHMRDAGELRIVLRRAVEAIVPKCFAAAVLEPLAEAKIPSQSTMARARLTADVAYMLCMRALNESLVGQVAHYMMVDSSVQGHYDLELIRLTSLQLDKAAALHAAARELHTLWQPIRGDPDCSKAEDWAWMEERAARERELMDAVRAALSTHLPPSVIIGSGHAKLWHKMHSVIHGLWLETGTAPLLDAFCKAIVAFTTDQGTESGLSKVPILRVTSVLPWMPKPQAEQSEHELAPGPDNVAQHENAVIDLTGSVSVAGLLHIAHNSTIDLAKSMEQFDGVVAQMQAVSRLLRKKDSKARLLESCYSDPVGRHLQSDLRAFTAKVHTG